MSPPGISPYKITKDLEEKVKEAKEKKDQFDSMYPKYIKIQSIFKKYGINKFDETFKKIDNFYNEKRYVDAYELLNKSKEEIEKEAFNLISDLKKEMNTFLNKLNDLGLNITDFLKLLEASTNDLQEFEKFIEKFNIDLRVFLKNSLKNSIGKLNSETKIKIEKSFGKQIENMDKMENNELISLIETVKKMITEYYMEKINIEMERMDKLRSLYEKLKLNLSKFKEIDEFALNAIKTEDYDAAIKKIKNFNDEMEVSVKRILREVINNLMKSIEEAKNLNLDTKSYLNDLNKIEELFDKGNYSSAIDSIKALNATIEESKIKIIGEKLEGVRRNIQELKNQGINVEEFIKSFEIAKNFLNSKKFNDSMKILDLLLKQSKSIRDQKNKLINAIDEFKESIREFSELGISVNIDYLEKLRKMSLENPAKANEEFEKYYSNIAKKIENSRTNYVSQMGEMIRTLKKLGLSTVELEEITKKDMGKSSFLIVIKNFREKFLNLLNSYQIDQMFKDLNNEEIKNEIKPIIQSIKNSLEKYDFNSVIANLKRLSESTMNLKNVFMAEKIKNTRKMITNLVEIGLDLKDLIIDIDTLEKEKDISDEQKLQAINSLEKNLLERTNMFILPRQEMGESVQKNIEIRNLKIDTEIISKRIYNLRTKSNPIDLSDSFKIAMDVENISKSKLISSMGFLTSVSFVEKKLSKYFNSASKYLEELKEDPEDLNKFKDVLGIIDQAYALNSFSYLRSMIKEANDIINITGFFQDKKSLFELKNLDLISLEPIYIDLEKLKNEFREKIYVKILDLNLVISSLPIKETKMEINEIMDNYLNNDYLEAWKKLTKLENYVNSILRGYEDASSQLKSLEGRIEFFDNIGLEMEKSKNIINDLRTKLSEGDFQDFRDSYRSNYLAVKNDIYSKVDEFLNSIENSIIQKKNKINTLIAEGLITSARRTLKLDNPIDAVRQGMEALENIQEYDFLKNITEKLIKRMKSSQENFGVQAPKEFSEGFNKVQILIHQGKYTNAIFEMHNLLSKFENLSDRISIIKRKIDEIKEKISVGVLLGVKTQEVLDLYQKARTSFQSMNIENTIKLLDDAIKSISIGLEKNLSFYRNSIFFLSEISKELGLSIEKEVKEIDYLIIKIIDFSFKRNNLDKDTITNVSNSLKKKLDDFDKNTFVKINEFLEKKVKKLENALKETGNNNTKDVDFILDAWSRKAYTILMDTLPMIDYKITKYYIVRMLDYSRNAFTEISDKIVFTGKVDNYVINSFKFSENAGEIEFNDYIDALDKFTKELDESISVNFNQKISALKKDFNLNNTDISNLNDFLLKKDYRSLEISIIKMGILQSWLKFINSFLTEKIEEVNKKIEDLEKIGLDLHEDRSFINSIYAKTYSDAIKTLENINEILNKKENVMPVPFNVKLNSKIGKEEIPLKLYMKYNGKVQLKNVSINISGSLENISIKIEQLKPLEVIERDFISKPGKGDELILEISYSFNDNSKSLKKSVLFKTTIDRGFVKKKATGEEKCGLCKGKIFKDLDMIICSKCGATYHYQCAQRIKKCISCGNIFDFSEEKDVEVSFDL
ncbi:MAG: RING finger protein [Thermoplasmata archaeon]